MKPQKTRKRSSFASNAVWGELAIFSSSGVEKQCMLLKKTEYVMGRSRRCDVRISIKTVSRTHVRIQLNPQPPKMSLTNCGSGEDDLFLNRSLIKPGEKVALSFGDVIKLSGKVFKLYSPREEQSVIQDDTLLCSQQLDNTIPHPGGGGGARGTRCLPQPREVTEKKFTTTVLPQKRKAFPPNCPRETNFKSSPAPASCGSNDSALGTPEAKNTKSSAKSVRFSHFNQVKADGIQVYSPATKRMKLADRKLTPGPARLFRAGQLPQELGRNHSAKKRLSERKQILRTKGFLSKSLGSQSVQQKLLLTPSLKQKTEEQRREEIMAILLASSPELETVNEQPKSFRST